jgi:hypothetical protein
MGSSRDHSCRRGNMIIVIATLEDDAYSYTGTVSYETGRLSLEYNVFDQSTSFLGQKVLDFAKQICLRSSNWREKYSQRIVATDLVNMPCK